VKTGKNQMSRAQAKTREDFYDWLAATITIAGIDEVARDKDFDRTRPATPRPTPTTRSAT
jgi:hypothetical protein